jgi:quercetin dioxygenase-like cupin family protein
MKTILVMALIFSAIGCASVQKINTQSTNNMNLKNLHTENKAVQTHLLFQPSDGKVVSLQIAKGKQLEEHITMVQALLVCVSGKATYNDENGHKISLLPGDYYTIQPNVKHWVDAIEESNFLLIK